MKKIVVIGLGPGDEGALTLKAVENLNEGRKTYLRTVHHPTVNYLDRNGIKYETYDSYYEEKEDFIDVYRGIADELIKKAQEFQTINYCVPGHPLIAEKTVEILLEREEAGEVDIEIVEGLSFIEPMILSMKKDPIEGLKLIDGLDVKNQHVDINTDNLITQVYNQSRASDLKLDLAEVYGDDYEVYVIRAAGMSEEKKVKVPIYELDRLEWIDYLTSIYIPKVERENKSVYDLSDLLGIMEELRSENGCAWDIKQTHDSLKRYVIEEAYEVVDAIDNDDMDGLVEELGDLMLQIVFHSQIGREEGYFSIWDVIKSISVKMVSRHPNVFKESEHDASDDWNEIKAKEKQQTTHTERLNSVPKSFPALMRSEKVQKRASNSGFDWQDVSGALMKLNEELGEVEREIDMGSDRIAEEIGDLLFSVVNVCRFLKIDPERALYDSTDKFIDRFSKVEREVIGSNRKIEDLSMEELDDIWEQIKNE